ARSLDLFLLLFLHQGKKSKRSLRGNPSEKKRFARPAKKARRASGPKISPKQSFFFHQDQKENPDNIFALHGNPFF
ncbi:MAG: hypothetical protein ABW007_18275, partial [Chitinophagaceae bacterium]